MVDMSDGKRQDRLASPQVEIRLYDPNLVLEGRLTVIGLILLVGCLLAGAALPIAFGAGSYARETWDMIFIASGTLCLGFGSASVLFQYFRTREHDSLLAQYDSLKMRADKLLDEFSRYEKSRL
jgi:hypothetical protein